MWSTLFLCLCLAAANADYSSWKGQTTYIYELQGRTLASLYQVADQYTGILLKANLYVFAASDDHLIIEVRQLQYANVHANLSDGWKTHIPESKLNYKQLPLNNNKFELKLNKGVVRDIVVSQNTPTWELNILKAVASLLQLDVDGVHRKKSSMNQYPENYDKFNAVYKTMEDSVAGECETLYDISEFPLQVPQVKPQLAFLKKAGSQLIDVIKTRNFSNCDNRPAYHFGITGATKSDPASSIMGDIMSISSVSQMILSGSMKRNTLQFSDTLDKVIISPFLYNPQKGLVVSHMNITLASMESAESSPNPVRNPQIIDNLVYEYDYQGRYSLRRQISDETASISSSSSSSLKNSQNSKSQDDNSSLQSHNEGKASTEVSSSSSESNENKQNAAKPRNRSVQVNYLTHGSSESSSSSSYSSSSGSSSSSSESESEEYFMLPKPQLSQAPNVPFLPFFNGIGGQSIQSLNDINIASVVQKIAHQIAEDLESPSAVPGQNTLTKFTVLVQVIRTMNADQLQQLTNKLYYQPSEASGSSSDSIRTYRKWVIYRDAVAQAGTGPALLAIKDMIEAGKAEGEEAAELLEVLPTTAQLPTTQYLSTLFELSTSQQVTKQKFLNASAILSFSELLRKAQVHSASAHNNYPVNTFGWPVPKNSQEITNRYIPYLEHALSQAIKDGDSPRIQVYIVALGRIAHPRILNVFEPYLEGKKPISEFQRFLVAAALNDIVKIHPKIVRPVLFRIYQNVGESYKLRVVAAYLLVKTNPPVQILQRMAQFTNEDISEQVNAAVQSIIRSAANLQNPNKKELRMNAQAAVGLLNPKNYGQHYSMKSLKSFLVQDLHLSYEQAAGYVGSKDSLIPHSIFYSFKDILGGYHRESRGFSFMASSVDVMREVFEDQFAESSSFSTVSQSTYSSDSSRIKYSASNLANILNFERNEANKVEANVLFTVFGGKRFLSIDNHTIEQLPEIVRSVYKTLYNGQNFNYAKIYNQYSVVLAVPTAMGLPFVYDLNNPTIVSIEGDAKVKSSPHLVGEKEDKIKIPDTINASAAIHFVYSTQAQAKLGFVTPFNHQQDIAGVDTNIHINMPVRVTLDADSTNSKVQMKVQPLQPHKEQNIFEFSSTPYTSKHSIKDLLHEPQGASYEEIYLRRPNQIHKTLGEDSTGFAFKFNYESQQRAIGFPEFLAAARKHDFISATSFLWAEESINKFNITVMYVPEKTTADYAKFTFAYAESRESNEHHENIQGPVTEMPSASMAEPTSSTPDSQNRQKQFLRSVSSGIQNSTAVVIDASAQFRGKTDAEYVGTVAVASSYVSSLSRILLFFGKSPAQNNANSKSFQACLSTYAFNPAVPEINYARALNSNPTSYLNAQLRFGENCSSNSAAQVTLANKFKQSSERRHYVQQLPLTQQCKQEMEEGNYAQYACRNATVEANLFDEYSLQITYDKIPDYVKNITYKTYSVARFFANPHVSEDIVSSSNVNNKLNIKAKVESDLQSFSVSIDAPQLSAKFSNLYLNQYVRSMFVTHPQYSILRRLSEQVFTGQQYSTCAIDNNKANTFDNKSYPIQLGNCWYVLLASMPKQYYDAARSHHRGKIYSNRDSAVYVRRDSVTGNQHVMIQLSDYTVVLSSSRPSSPSSDYWSDVSIQVNNQQLESASKNNLAEFSDSDGEPLIQYYALPNGEVKLRAPKHGIEITYSGESVKVQVESKYWDKTKGLCGNSDTEPSTDFTSPDNFILDNPDYFTASYAVTDENCEDSVRSLQERAKHAVRYRQEVIYGNVVSDRQTLRKKQTDKIRSSDVRSTSDCVTKRVQYIKDTSNGKVCFTTRPYIACKQNCRAEGSTRREVTVYCLQQNAAVQHWMSAVDNGANPDFSQKQPQQTIAIQVPQSCVP